ncbi:sodium:calcium antiporter [Thermococcus siculi]|uniref:Sodium:calcium antiporter n=1 Tax=Thermococcus siculi TaxID=72803 RepID=A0A2Z2MXU1_9EURY|nr:calcium/sodium antiporter [Thermococcus siculi]ASJ08963.1 sodium:calcium antiporter [Thermococcus siculi]
MEWLLWTGAIIIGLILLITSGDRLSDKIVEVARKAGVSTLVISIVLISLATTLPELLTSAIASYHELTGMALGNVLGSIFANIALILGLAAMIRPLKATRAAYENSLVMLVSIALVIVLSIDGTLSRFDGLILLGGYVLYLRWLLKKHAREEAEGHETGKATLIDYAILLALGLILVLGARMVVYGGKNIAEAMGISDFVIGATIVAIGTSLPEMTNALYGAIRERGTISIGNVIGADIMNAFVVLGVAALIRPLQTGASVITIILVLAVMIPMVLSLRRTHGLGRPIGAYFLFLYALYLYLMFAGYEL